MSVCNPSIRLKFFSAEPDSFAAISLIDFYDFPPQKDVIYLFLVLSFVYEKLQIRHFKVLNDDILWTGSHTIFVTIYSSMFLLFS